MPSTFLALTNRILIALNEVPLTNADFASATGFHAEAKEAVRQALFDVYRFEDTEWPFLWSTFTFNTSAGTSEYTKDSLATSIDWDSFKIMRGYASITNLVQSGGTATATTSTAHNFLTNDEIYISGANETEYNTTVPVPITVTGANTFTFTVASTATSPATGTIVAKSGTVLQRKLFSIGYDKYRTDFWDKDNNLTSTEYGFPTYIARKTNNNLILSTVPDRVYEVYYEGFTLPVALSDYDDETLVPEAFDQVILDKAFHYAYMFRDNLEQAQVAQSRYEDNARAMRRILIPQDSFCRYSY